MLLDGNFSKTGISFFANFVKQVCISCFLNNEDHCTHGSYDSVVCAKSAFFFVITGALTGMKVPVFVQKIFYFVCNG